MYSQYDLIWLAICLVVCVAVGAILLNVMQYFKNPWVRRIPFMVITVTLFIGEIVKQCLSFNYYGAFYRIHSLPLFICSSLYIWYTMAAFFPLQSITARIGNAMAHCMSICITVGVLLAPKIILYSYTTRALNGDPDFYVYHSLFFHFVIMMWAVLSIFLRAYSPDKRDIQWIFILLAAFMVVPATATILLHHDYAGFGTQLSFITFEWLRIVIIATIYTAVMSGLSVLVLILLPIYIKQKLAKNKT